MNDKDYKELGERLDRETDTSQDRFFGDNILILVIPFDISICISEENFARDWNLTRLSYESGLSYHFIHSILNEKIKVPLEYANNFSKAFGTSVEFWEFLIDKHNRSVMND